MKIQRRLFQVIRNHLKISNEKMIFFRNLWMGRRREGILKISWKFQDNRLKIILFIFLSLFFQIAVSETVSDDKTNREVDYILRETDVSLRFCVFINKGMIKNVRINESFGGGSLILNRIFDDGVEIIYKNNGVADFIYIKKGQNISTILSLINKQRNTFMHEHVLSIVELKK